MIEILVLEGRAVDLDTPILQMDSEAEDMALIRVRAAESVRKIRSAQYTGEQLAVLINLAKVAVEKAESNLRAAHLATEHAKSMIAGGVVGWPKDADDAIREQVAQNELNEAKDQQKQLNFSIERHNMIDSIAAQLSLDHETFLNRKRARLTIRAPRKGIIKKLMVAKGSFAELGSILAEIE